MIEEPAHADAIFASNMPCALALDTGASSSSTKSSSSKICYNLAVLVSCMIISEKVHTHTRTYVRNVTLRLSPLLAIQRIHGKFNFCLLSLLFEIGSSPSFPRPRGGGAAEPSYM